MTKFKLSFWTLAVTTEILAGIQIENENFVGADLHATIIDIYYPDWNGDLKHIGFAKETTTATTTNKASDGEMCMKKNKDYEESKAVVLHKNKKQQMNDKANNNNDDDDHNDGICSPDDSTNKNANSSSEPFFTVKPRGTSISKSNAVTIFVNDMSPRVYLNFVKDAIMKSGSLELFISGVAHVKTPLGIPLSVGLMCENSVNLKLIPMEILGKNCEVRGMSPGWAGLTEYAAQVRGKAMDIIKKRIITKDEERKKTRDEEKREKKKARDEERINRT